ncbi:MAG: ParA family protein [Cyanobacteria bacterium P01_F01_bin.33]
MLAIAVFNFKGGTGKSTTTLNLGACLARHQIPTVAVDLDGQRTLSFGLGMDGVTPTALDWLSGDPNALANTSQANLALIPGDIGLFRLDADKGMFGKAVKGIRGYDVLMMDCSPGLGVASVQALLNCDRVLLPTLCEPAALKGVSEAVSLIRDERADVPIDVVRVRYKPRLVLTREVDDLLVESAEDLGYRLLHATIPENIAVAESIAHQQPISNYAPKSSGALAYGSLAKEISKVWGLR